MDGYQVCRRLKRDERTAHIPIVMLTVNEHFDALMEGLETGADDYISKDEYAVKNLMITLEAFGLLNDE
jgi:CheY-like chemotaxis protein